MLTTLVISCCLVFIFLQLTNPYISLAKNAIKHTTTETYLISYRLANIHNIIKTISLAAYANAKYGLLLKVRYTARKLVVTDIVLGMMLAVTSKKISIRIYIFKDLTMYSRMLYASTTRWQCLFFINFFHFNQINCFFTSQVFNCHFNDCHVSDRRINFFRNSIFVIC